MNKVVIYARVSSTGYFEDDHVRKSYRLATR